MTHWFRSRCLVHVVLAISLMSHELQAQHNQPLASSHDLATSSTTPLRIDQPRVHHVAISGTTAYFIWPRGLTYETVLCACDLTTGRALWSQNWSDDTIYSMVVVDGFVVIHTASPDGVITKVLRENNGTAVPMTRPNGETFLEVFSSLSRRQFLAEAVVAAPYVALDTILVPSEGRIVGDLDHTWKSAVIDQGLLYTREEGDGMDDPAAFGVIRRIALNTGQEELKTSVSIPLESPDTPVYRRLTAARGDLVILAESRSRMRSRLVAYDLKRQEVIWRQAPPGDVIKVTFNPEGMLEWTGQGDSIYGTQVIPKSMAPVHPMLIDPNTGSFHPAPDWRDPYSVVRWYEPIVKPAFCNQTDARIILHHDHLVAVDPKSGERRWQTRLEGIIHNRPGNLGNYVLTAGLGSLQIIDVTTGNSREVRPEDFGLKTIPQPPLPSREEVQQEVKGSPIHNAADDKTRDRTIYGIFAIPVVIWLAAQLWTFRFRRKG